MTTLEVTYPEVPRCILGDAEVAAVKILRYRPPLGIIPLIRKTHPLASLEQPSILCVEFLLLRTSDEGSNCVNIGRRYPIESNKGLKCIGGLDNS